MSDRPASRKIRRIARDERGQSLVEFALALPVLCLVLFAIVQFGIAFYNYIDLTSAARDGARKAAVMRDQPDGVAAAQEAVRNSATAGKSELQIDVTPGQPWKSGDEVRVKVSRPYEIAVMGIKFYSGPMRADAVARIE